MAEEKKIRRRVTQGHSVLHAGIWHHQGDTFECSPTDTFRAAVATHDQAGKFLGNREVDPTEVLPDPEAPKGRKTNKEEEG